MTQRCTNCGFSGPDYANCCPNCGAPLGCDRQRQYNPPQPQRCARCGGTGALNYDIFGFPCPPGPQVAQRRTCSVCNGRGFI